MEVHSIYTICIVKDFAHLQQEKNLGPILFVASLQ